MGNSVPALAVSADTIRWKTFRALGVDAGAFTVAVDVEVLFEQQPDFLRRVQFDAPGDCFILGDGGRGPDCGEQEQDHSCGMLRSFIGASG